MERSSRRDRLSSWLPWITYDPKKQTHLLTDNTVAYMWEISPVTYAGLAHCSNMEGILKQPFPLGTIVQFILYPDDDISMFLDAYAHGKTRLTDISQRTLQESIKFYEQGKSGLKKNANIPVRNFRGFVVIKSTEDLSELVPTIEELLKTAQLHPERLDDSGLIQFVSGLLNGKPSPRRKHHPTRKQNQIYNRDKALREECISRETHIDWRGQFPFFNNRYGACLTPSDTPEEIDPLRTNNLFGGINGLQDDSAQLNFPFLYSVNIIYDNTEDELAQKARWTMNQNIAGSFMAQIARRVKEFRRFQHDQAGNEKYVKVIPTLWVFGSSEETVRRNIGRAKAVWHRKEAGGFELQQERTLNTALFISSLPGGLYNIYDNIRNLDRHLYMSKSAAARMLPIQGDYAGNGRPVMLAVGRKGQIAGVDVFAKQSPNSNFIVGAESGAGKTFLLNTMLSDYYMAGEKVRLLDLGRGYEKLCHTVGGKFIDFKLSGNNTPCINPLDFVSLDEEDEQGNITAAATVFGEMVYAGSSEQLKKHQWQLLKTAARWGAEKKERAIKGSDAIYEWLTKYEEITKGTSDYVPGLEKDAEMMAFCMKDFTSKGPYGKLFVGESTFSIANDDFAVVELDDIKGDKELFSVVILQMMNAITQDLYLGGRDNRRFILIEEAATLLKKHGHTDLSRLGTIVEEGYRRARKYGGSVGIVLQSIMDAKLLGDVGEVALANAGYKFLLSSKSGQYNIACDQKILDYPQFTQNILSSLKNNKPNYSEFYLESPQGSGVLRLTVDSWRYWVNTSESEEQNRYYTHIKQGKTPYEALDLCHKGR